MNEKELEKNVVKDEIFRIKDEGVSRNPLLGKINKELLGKINDMENKIAAMENKIATMEKKTERDIIQIYEHLQFMNFSQKIKDLENNFRFLENRIQNNHR